MPIIPQSVVIPASAIPRKRSRKGGSRGYPPLLAPSPVAYAPPLAGGGLDARNRRNQDR